MEARCSTHGRQEHRAPALQRRFVPGVVPMFTIRRDVRLVRTALVSFVVVFRVPGRGAPARERRRSERGYGVRAC